MNRNKELSILWAAWNYYKFNDNISWRNFINKFNFFIDFELALSDLLNTLNQRTSIFDGNPVNRVLENAEKIQKSWENDGIKSIIFSDFSKFQAMSYIKHVNWFFYKGNIELLNEKSDHYISVIGSRKTDFTFTKWISEKVPKNKIVVSGLANGADVLGHKVAIINKQKIIVFPGTDIYKLNFPKNEIKKEILEYALSGNGLLLTDQFPGTKNYDETMFLNRNRWMAQISSTTYVVYFKGISGTLGQMIETLKLSRKIYMPKEVYSLNEVFLDNHKSFVNWRHLIEWK